MREELPRFRLRRNRKSERAVYYGPFPQAGLLRSTLSEMRKKFGILLTDSNPVKLPDGKYKLYDDARAEIFAGHNETTPEEYRERVEEACSFLEGKAKDWLNELKEEMNRRAEALEFERAAELRDLTTALAKTIGKARRFSRKWPKEEQEEGGHALAALKDSLGLKKEPTVIECFDISHVSGTFVVASMVRFVEGRADRSSYRRFKVLGGMGNDDFRSMEEVVGRRYGRLRDEGKPFPDLVVVDGGIGQVGAALKAFFALNIEVPALIGLAKREETIVFPDQRGELLLPARDYGLRLLQRVRDEAHRFANQFNADLRSKKIRESILDEFSGLGKVKRAALMEHFGSLEKLKKATVAEMTKVDGIGQKLASRLAEFLEG